MIHRSPEPLAYPENASLTDVLLHFNINNTPPHKPAIIDGISGEVIFTYASFRTGVRKVARHLQHELGIRPEMVVGILSNNRNYYPVCVHGILATGAVVSALNPAYEPNEIAHALKLSKPSHILVEAELIPRLVIALQLTPELAEKLTLHVWDSDKPEPGVHEALNIESIIQHGSADFEPASLPRGTTGTRLAFICFRSGTSGLVKGVRLSHRNVVANIFQQSQGLRGMFTPEIVLALIVPFFHVLGLVGFSCQYVCQGAPIVAFRRFQLRPLLEAVKKHRITHINVVPPIALEFLRNPIASEGDYSSLQCLINAAAPLSQRQADELSGRLGCAVVSWYGMTEASPSIASQREDEARIPGTIGRLLPGIEMRVLDEYGADAQVGEFVIRGPNVMQGYVHDVEKLDDPMTQDDFLRTGDIGYVDEKGYLFLVDRAKEMIKVKGQQVAPAELESILMTHPLVNDAAVCGTYDEHGTSEMPVAYVTTDVQDLRDQQRLKSDLLMHVHAQVARYKQLKGGVHIIPQIPRNPSGKILRRLLPAKLGQGVSQPAGGINSPSVPAKL